MNTTKLHHETFEKIKIYHNFERNQINETEKKLSMHNCQKMII